MKRHDLTIIDVTKATLTINRAGREAGITGVGKLCKVTPKRAKRCLSLAVKLGLVYAYKNSYRSNVERVCYAITETGRIVLQAIESHDETTLWGKSND